MTQPAMQSMPGHMQPCMPNAHGSPHEQVLPAVAGQLSVLLLERRLQHVLVVRVAVVISRGCMVVLASRVHEEELVVSLVVR